MKQTEPMETAYSERFLCPTWDLTVENGSERSVRTGLTAKTIVNMDDTFTVAIAFPCCYLEEVLGNENGIGNTGIRSNSLFDPESCRLLTHQGIFEIPTVFRD